MERPPLILGQQQPLPGPNQPAIINFAHSIESPMEQMQALAPIVPYADEEMVEIKGYEEISPMHLPQLDVETLLFIARNNMRPHRANPMD